MSRHDETPDKTPDTALEPATDTASAALLRDVVEEMRHRAEEGCTGTHDVTCCGEDSDIHPEEWCHRCLMGVAARALASLPAPARLAKISRLGR